MKTKPIEGDAAQWDGTNPGEVEAVAGDAFKGTSGDDALILLRDDGIARVRPGWWVTSWGGVIVVVSEHAFAVWAQAA